MALDDILGYINEIKDKDTVIIYLINIVKQIGAESTLVYINEIKDENTVIIYLINIIKQVTHETDPDLETPVVKFRQRFREESDLERKLDLIHGFIEHHKLTIHNHSNHANLPDQTTKKAPLEDQTTKKPSLKNQTTKKSSLEKQFKKLEKALEQMRYTDFNKIKDLKKENKKVDYKRNKKDYNDKKEILRGLLDPICQINEKTIANRFVQGVFHQYFLEGFDKILETRDEADTTSYLTDAQEEAMITYAEGSGQLSTGLANQLRRRIYKKSAQEFYEKQAWLKEKEKEKELKK